MQGEYQAGGGEGRLHKLKNLHQPGQPKQPCDVVTLFKPDDQIAFERNEERRRRGRSESSIFFEHLENIRDCFSLEITPLKSFRERMQCLITKQGRLANQLAKELDHLLKTRWKDAYSSFLICGKQELVELGYREDDAQKMHALVLFYKPLPKEPTPL